MKQTSSYVCSECGYESPKWLGKCPKCASWNTFSECEIKPAARYEAKKTFTSQIAKPLNDIRLGGEDERIKTEIAELDRVLGGGIVQGSLVLVGGDPGIGKSTLLLQICKNIADKNTVLYASGEESDQQIKLRAARLGVEKQNLYILSETNLDTILSCASGLNPKAVIIDSIQTIFKEEIQSAPGSVSQVREATLYLMKYAKENNVAVFIVGHVTKDGSIAGPRVLEHMVDCVLYFEGERSQSYRILRTIKNRFGSTNEIGVFEMTDKGLIEVANPSKMLLEGRAENSSGSTVVCTLEGTRPVMAEVQALCSPTGFGNPRRMATGIDFNRAVLLTAILEKKLGYPMQNQDVYINVIGGIKILETATDLAVIIAIASNIKNFIIDSKTLIIGEVGLTSEVRSVGFCEKRTAEAEKMGFDFCILPHANAEKLKGKTKLKLLGVKNVSEAIQYLKKIQNYREKSERSETN